MVMTIWNRRRSASVAGGLLLAIAISGAAYAISSNAFTYTTARNGFHTINHYQMTPKTDQTGYNNFQSGLSVESAGCFNTGVHLPDGAVIKTLAMSYRGKLGSI